MKLSPDNPKPFYLLAGAILAIELTIMITLILTR